MAIAFVSGVSRGTGGTTAAINTTGANLLIAAAGFTNSTTCFPSVSDSKANNWIPITTVQSTAGVVLFMAVNATVGTSHTFTVQGTTSSVAVAAFSGASTTFPFGQSKVAATTAASIQPGSITPPITNCLMIAAMAYRDTTTISVNSSFTISNQVPFASGVQVGVALAYLIETSIVTTNPTFSWTNSAVCSACQAIFQIPTSNSGGESAYAFIG